MNIEANAGRLRDDTIRSLRVCGAMTAVLIAVSIMGFIVTPVNAIAPALLAVLFAGLTIVYVRTLRTIDNRLIPAVQRDRGAAGIVFLFFVILALAWLALALWLLISGIIGVTQDGATGWEITKIVLGGLMLIGGGASRA